MTEQSLVAWLADACQREDARLEPLQAGHTNSSFLVHSAQGRCVLRAAWAGKPADQVAREATVLRHVHRRIGRVVVPVVLAVREADPWLHLFEHIPGAPGGALPGARATASAMHTLALLHAVLGELPADTTAPVHWLQSRWERVAARPLPALPESVLGAYASVLDRIRGLLVSACEWLTRDVQWLHGDYHAGNLLLDDDGVCGIVDFDETGQGSPWLEAAFAGFALCRDPRVEARFAFDAAAWREAMAAYALADGDADAECMTARFVAHRADLALLFCADQVLIHLEAAQRGLWSPGPGMGFLGCWQTLAAQP